MPTQTQETPKQVSVAEKVPENLDTTGWAYDAASDVCSADPLIISDSVEVGAQRVLAAIQDNAIGRSLDAFPGMYLQRIGTGENNCMTVAALCGNEGLLAHSRSSKA